jgi:hypothetical protein
MWIPLGQQTGELLEDAAMLLKDWVTSTDKAEIELNLFK